MNRGRSSSAAARQVAAGFAAIAAAPLFIVSLFILRGVGVPLTGLATEQLRAVDQVSGVGDPLPPVLSALALALITIPLLYLFQAAQVRSERVNPAMIGFVFIGPLLFAVADGDQGDRADPARLGLRRPGRARGGDVYTLLDDLIDDSTPERRRLVPDPPGAARPGRGDGLRAAATRCGSAC